MMRETRHYHNGDESFRDLCKIRVFSYSEHSPYIPNESVNKIIITCSLKKKIFIITLNHYQLFIVIIHFTFSTT